MKPAGVGASVNEQNDECASLRGVMAFLGPCPDLAAVGRIAEHTMLPPVLIEAVILAGEKVFTFVIVVSRACIKREMKLAIEHVVGLHPELSRLDA